MISIITVVYKDHVGLSRTIKSLEMQSISKGNIEYIVIDGNSNCSEINSLGKRELVSTFISESDRGIYDAMNKGINLSSGDWIYFLNAGDILENNDVLTELLNEIDKINKDNSGINLIYGAHRADGIVNKQSCSLSYLVSHMINHQSMIYHRSLFRHIYDNQYRFCADYAHLLSIWSQLKPKKLEICIANFDTTGVSSQEHNKARMWQERLQAVWRSDLNLLKKILLSSRGVIAWPYHYLKMAHKAE